MKDLDILLLTLPGGKQVTRLVAPDGRTSIIDTAAWDRENCDPRMSIEYAQRSIGDRDGVELHIASSDAEKLIRRISGYRVIEFDDRARGAQ